MIPIARPIVGDDEKRAVSQVLESRILAQGPRVKEFEGRFSRYIGTDFGIAAASGTAALHLSLLAMGVSPGDEVITTPLTFFATASTIMMVGAKPVFVDVQRDSLNIDPESIKGAITPKTKAIVPVHLYGLPADMDEILYIALENNLLVLEDACQAHGATYKCNRAGALGDAGCFSFYPTKNMMGGEGGIVTTDDPKIAEMVRLLRSHGCPERYKHVELGYNLRMTDLCAAVALCQLDRLDGFNLQREENARRLTETVNGIEGLTPPPVKKDRVHVYHQYAVLVEDSFPMKRDQLIEFMKGEGVYTEPGYPMPLHRQPVFEKYQYGGGDCPVADEVSGRTILLPVHPSLSDEDMDVITGALKKAVKG